MHDEESIPSQKITAQTRAQFMLSPEGRIFTTGCVMLILWLATIAICYRLHLNICSEIIGMGLRHIAFGRALSIAYGTAVELPRWLIALLAIYADVMAMFVMYPVLVFCYKNLFERTFFKRHMKPVFETAQRSVGRLRQFKIIGVFLFVWFPFWMTGIITGAVLGFLIGLRTWVNMMTVILGATSAVICWVYAYDLLFGWLDGVQQGVSVVASSLLLVVLVILRIVRLRRRNREKTKQSGGKDSAID